MRFLPSFIRRMPAWGRVAALVGAAAAALVVAFAVDRALYAGEVLRGVSLSGVSLSGLDRTEVERQVADRGERLRASPIRVRVRDRGLELLPEQIGVRLDVGKTVDDVLEEGRRGGGLRRSRSGWPGSVRNLPPRVDFDAAALEKVLGAWDDAVIHDPPFEGAVVVRGGAVAAEYPRGGHRIDREAARRLIAQSLAGALHGELDLPLVEMKPGMASAAVDAAVERARGLLAGPVVLLAEHPKEEGAELEKDKRNEGKQVGEPPDQLQVRFERRKR